MNLMRKIVFFVLIGFFPLCASSNVIYANETPSALIEDWQTFWNDYDLSKVESLFHKSDELTYFSSEKVGLVQGFPAIIKHHEGFGFVSGGTEKNTKLWLEDTQIHFVGEAAVISAIWYFVTVRDGAETTMKGPVTFVSSKDTDGNYKFNHVHFANY